MAESLRPTRCRCAQTQRRDHKNQQKSAPSVALHYHAAASPPQSYQRLTGGAHAPTVEDQSGGDIGWWDQGAAPGPQGRRGDPDDINQSTSKQGNSPNPVVRAGDVGEIATHLPITQLSMTLSRAYVSFANRDFDDLGNRLDWLRQTANSSESGSKFYDDRSARAASSAVGRPTRAELDGIGQQASILVDRLRLERFPTKLDHARRRRISGVGAGFKHTRNPPDSLRSETALVSGDTCSRVTTVTGPASPPLPPFPPTPPLPPSPPGSPLPGRSREVDRK